MVVQSLDAASKALSRRIEALDPTWDKLFMNDNTGSGAQWLLDICRLLLIAVDGAEIKYVDASADWTLDGWGHPQGVKLDVVVFTDKLLATEKEAEISPNDFELGGYRVRSRSDLQSIRLNDYTPSPTDRDVVEGLEVSLFYTSDVDVTIGGPEGNAADLVDFYPSLLADL